MTAFMLFVAALSSQFASDDPSDVTTLERYQWHNRLIVIFAPSETDERYLEQHSFLRQVREVDLAKRDLLVFFCFASDGFARGYVPRIQQAFSQDEARSIRETFGVSSDAFRVLLIGKDGGEKRRSDVPISVEALFQQIDSMPMRQQEMEESSSKF